MVTYIPESCAEYRLRLRGNYRDKDMPRYDLDITIFDTMRYIMPSLFKSQENKNLEKCEVRSAVHIIKCAHFLPKIKCVLHLQNNYGFNICKQDDMT